MAGYAHFRDTVVAVLEAARHGSVRVVNAVMTAAYWEIGRRIVEYEQAGAARAQYGTELLKRLSADLDGTSWARFLSAESPTDARILPLLPVSEDLPDVVWQIEPGNKPDTVWQINRSGFTGAA